MPVKIITFKNIYIYLLINTQKFNYIKILPPFYTAQCFIVFHNFSRQSRFQKCSPTVVLNCQSNNVYRIYYPEIYVVEKNFSFDSQFNLTKTPTRHR